VVKVRNLIKQGNVDIIKTKWVLDCVGQEALVTLEPRYFFSVAPPIFSTLPASGLFRFFFVGFLFPGVFVHSGFRSPGFGRFFLSRIFYYFSLFCIFGVLDCYIFFCACLRIFLGT
jgi:hypothetical protein